MVPPNRCPPAALPRTLDATVDCFSKDLDQVFLRLLLSPWLSLSASFPIVSERAIAWDLGPFKNVSSFPGTNSFGRLSQRLLSKKVI